MLFRSAQIDGRPTPLLQLDRLPSAPDGSYFAVLALYSGEESIAHAPLYRMQIVGGQIHNFEPVVYTVEAATPGLPAQFPANQRSLLSAPLALDARAIQIDQIVLKRRPAAPGAAADAPFAAGDALAVRIHWQATNLDPRALAISVQIIGAADTKIAQWDGAAGGDWYPASAWRTGDHIRQDVPLLLNPAAAPGTYRVLLAAYDPANGSPQLIAGQQAVVVGELVVR